MEEKELFQRIKQDVDEHGLELFKQHVLEMRKQLMDDIDRGLAEIPDDTPYDVRHQLEEEVLAKTDNPYMFTFMLDAIAEPAAKCLSDCFFKADGWKLICRCTDPPFVHPFFEQEESEA